MCLRDFWLANEEVLPTLSALVLCYGFLFSTSADVERTFSKYNSLLADDRKSLSDESLKKILFLFYNLNWIELLGLPFFSAYCRDIAAYIAAYLEKTVCIFEQKNPHICDTLDTA